MEKEYTISYYFTERLEETVKAHSEAEACNKLLNELEEDNSRMGTCDMIWGILGVNEV